MTKPSPEIEAKARARLAADERAVRPGGGASSSEPSARITGSRRTSQSLGEAWRAFWSHPSPFLIGAFLLGSLLYRATLHSFTWTELIVPVALVAFFPVIEWIIHVVILHWRPRKVGGVPGRLAPRAQAPRPPRRPAGAAAGVHPLAGRAVAAAVVRRDRAVRLPGRRQPERRSWSPWVP